MIGLGTSNKGLIILIFCIIIAEKPSNWAHLQKKGRNPFFFAASLSKTIVGYGTCSKVRTREFFWHYYTKKVSVGRAPCNKVRNPGNLHELQKKKSSDWAHHHIHQQQPTRENVSKKPNMLSKIHANTSSSPYTHVLPPFPLRTKKKRSRSRSYQNFFAYANSL